jgi:hypothetical protein
LLNYLFRSTCKTFSVVFKNGIVVNGKTSINLKDLNLVFENKLMSSFHESPEYKMIAGNLAILYLSEAIEGTARSSLKENLSMDSIRALATDLLTSKSETVFF